jgi:uncharacterized protein (TIGR02271 family)
MEREEVIPLVEERVSTTKRATETGRVRVRTRVEEREQIVPFELARDEIDIERVPVDREIAEMPPVRQEGSTIIVPVVEEIMVVEKRLVLVEEIHLHRRLEVEQHMQPVTLRSQRAEIEREGTGGETNLK